MAINGVVNTYDTSLVNKVELETDFQALQLPNTPILNRIGFGNRIESTRLEWFDDVPLPFTFSLTAAYASGTDATHFVIGNAALLKPNFILNVGGVLCKVISVDAAANKIEFAVIPGTGSLPTTLPIGTKLELISSAAVEGSPAITSGFLTAVKRFNVTQIFEDAISFTGTMMSIRQAYDTDERVRKTREKMERLRVLLEKTVVNGKLVDAADNTTPRMMGGFLEFINSNGYVASTTFSEENLKAFLKEMFNLRNQVPLVELWMNPATKEARFNPLLTEKIFISVNEQQAGKVTNRYISEWGEVVLNTAPVIPVDQLLVVDFNKMKVRPLRPLAMYELAKTGDSITYQIVGEYTLEVRDSALMGIMKLTA